MLVLNENNADRNAQIIFNVVQLILSNFEKTYFSITHTFFTSISKFKPSTLTV